MRLIDVNNLELRSFTNNDTPTYAILSHTWGPDEVSYQELVWINKIKALTKSFEEPPISSSTTSLVSQASQSSLMLASMEMLLRGNWNPGTSAGSMTEEDFMNRAGYSKIVNAAREVQALRICIDTCCTIQTHHRRQCTTKSAAYVAESGGTMYIAF